jgi:hypothetical protein
MFLLSCSWSFVVKNGLLTWIAEIVVQNLHIFRHAYSTICSRFWLWKKKKVLFSHAMNPKMWVKKQTNNQQQFQPEKCIKLTRKLLFQRFFSRLLHCLFRLIALSILCYDVGIMMKTDLCLWSRNNNFLIPATSLIKWELWCSFFRVLLWNSEFVHKIGFSLRHTKKEQEEMGKQKDRKRRKWKSLK